MEDVTRNLSLSLHAAAKLTTQSNCPLSQDARLGEAIAESQWINATGLVSWERSPFYQFE